MVKTKTSQKQYGFPDEAEIERVVKRMTQPGYRRINQSLSPNATTEGKKNITSAKALFAML